MTKSNHQHDITDAVQTMVRSGADVHQQVKDITLKALTQFQLDMDNIKNVTEAVSQGINEGLTAHGEQGKEVFMQAITALDDALAMAAEASKLAIEEAASRVSEYSEHDLNDAIKDLQEREGVFLETLGKIAKDSNQIIAGIMNDFIDHSGQSGTAVGKQTLIALDALKNLPQISKNIVTTSTSATASTLAQIGSGILSGIAESLKSRSTQ